ncbi:MAG: hypothetical protein QXO95_03910 [Candidatus Aenigmatarchaeota archaeon]
MGWFMDFLNKLSKAKKVKAFSMKENETYELTRSDLRVCELCNRKEKLWKSESVNELPVCDICLVRLYGMQNIEIIE